jgi:hypothetical protein
MRLTGLIGNPDASHHGFAPLLGVLTVRVTTTLS